MPLGLAKRGYSGVIQHLAAERRRLGAVGHRARKPADRARLRRGRPGRGAARGRWSAATRSRFVSRTSPSRCAGARPWPSSSPDATGHRFHGIAPAASRPGGHAEQRQDLAVQCADRQPAEGRELSGRHRRAQGRLVRHAAGAPGLRGRPARHLFAARPQPGRGDHPRLRARPGHRRDRARPRAVRGRFHQSAPDHPPAAGAQAHRPADDPRAQHVRHRDAAAASRSTSSGSSKELGVPVVTSIAVRKGGTADLLR